MNILFSKIDIEDGFSLAELLVAISLFSALLAISFPALSTGIRTARFLDQINQSITASEYLFAQIERVSLQSNKHLGTELISIAPSSILPSRLAATSDVLVLNDISLDTALSKDKNNSESNFCALFELPASERTRVENSKVQLLQTADGTALSSATIKKKVNVSCREYSLTKTSFQLNTPTPNFFSYDSSGDLLNKAAIAISVKDLYGYYLDDKETLRRYSFISGQSQPALQGVTSFDLTSVDYIRGKIIKLSIEIDGRTLSRSFFIPKIEPFAYLNLFFL